MKKNDEARKNEKTMRVESLYKSTKRMHLVNQIMLKDDIYERAHTRIAHWT